MRGDGGAGVGIGGMNGGIGQLLNRNASDFGICGIGIPVP